MWRLKEWTGQAISKVFYPNLESKNILSKQILLTESLKHSQTV